MVMMITVDNTLNLANVFNKSSGKKPSKNWAQTADKVLAIVRGFSIIGVC